MAGPWSSLGSTGPLGEDMADVAEFFFTGKELVRAKGESPFRGKRFAARIPDAQKYQIIESSTILETREQHQV